MRSDDDVADLIYTANVSLDGFMQDDRGRFDFHDSARTTHRAGVRRGLVDGGVVYLRYRTQGQGS